MKKAFTLLELVIVLVVIGILMGVTMYFGSNRIVDLKAQSLKDQFVDNFAAVQSQNLASSYHGEERYTTLEIALTENSIMASYDGSGSRELLPEPQNMKLKNITWTPTLSLTPYQIWCALDGSDAAWLSFDLEVNGNKLYCFTIDLAACTLKEVACWKSE